MDALTPSEAAAIEIGLKMFISDRKQMLKSSAISAEIYSVIDAQIMNAEQALKKIGVWPWTR